MLYRHCQTVKENFYDMQKRSQKAYTARNFVLWEKQASSETIYIPAGWDQRI